MSESSPSWTATRPVAPVAPYLGGKRNLAALVIQRIRDVPHEIYVEPFVGMGGVFLRRPFRARCEVINDISHDVSTLFRILQRHYVPFMDMLRWQLASRAEFERLIAVKPETLTDLERAARFLYLQRNAYGGKVTGRSFGTSFEGGSRFDITRLASILEDVHDRLAGVTIERLPWAEMISRYDQAGALFYLDPPYYGCEGDYGPGVFGGADFLRMAEMLRQLKGKFILSLNDRPEVRAIFEGFVLDAVQHSYRVSGEPTPAQELLISNIRPEDRSQRTMEL